jgi:flagellar FliL protein
MEVQMTDATADPAAKPAKGSKLPLLLGIVAGLAAAGAGYYAATSGMLSGDGASRDASHAAEATHQLAADVAFVELQPVLVGLGGTAPGRHLRFEGHLEVVPGSEAEVAALMPRIMDVLNGYLRATETADIEDPAALIRLRAQMLRRIQVVTGNGSVRDLLITSFLIS